MSRIRSLALALLLAPAASFAAEIRFDSNPFEGSPANPDDGQRTVFGAKQISLPAFNVKLDRFVFDAQHFALGDVLGFANGLASSFVGSDARLFVINDTSANFNAGSAANAIAEALTTDGAGLFLYHNVGLGVNRLVYSTNLNLNTADLAILARIDSPTGTEAFQALPSFSAANFALAQAVPAPGSLLLALGALLGVGGWARRPSRAAQRLCVC